MSNGLFLWHGFVGDIIFYLSVGCFSWMARTNMFLIKGAACIMFFPSGFEVIKYFFKL